MMRYAPQSANNRSRVLTNAVQELSLIHISSTK